ncbi:MAG: PadR family transcriptional regulator [Synechococcales cyanobacterium K32_A2020_035]|nr:PadR family transcriptional regulator [Synechococcales cyanobacterium K32_A2020_035]
MSKTVNTEKNPEFRKKIRLSTVEELVMTVLWHQTRELYGLEISDVIEKAAGDNAVSFGSLYPALRRLEEKGFLVSRWGDETKERGGARRRYYKVTADGIEAVQRIQDIRDQLANLIFVTA